MIELVVALLVIGAALVVFSPVLAGRGATRPGLARPARRESDSAVRDQERTALRERKRRLLRNLKELEAERAAGRVTPADYVALRDRDQAEAARVIRQLEDVEAAPQSGHRASRKQAAATASVPPPVPPRQRVARVAAWVGGIMVFGGALAFTMSRAITARAPGGTITGTIPGGTSQIDTRLAELEQIIRRDSSHLEALLEAGHVYLQQQRLDDAARVTLRAVQIDSLSPEAHAHIAMLLMAEASGHENQDSAVAVLGWAVKEIDRSLSIEPDFAEGWLFKGMIYMQGLQDQDAAIAAWEHYLKIAPPDADTTRIAAMVRSARGR